MNETKDLINNINQGLTNGSSYIEKIIETVHVFFGSMNNIPEGDDKDDKEDDKEDDISNEETEWNEW